MENLNENFLKYKYWSGYGGGQDSTKNYSVIIYKLEPLDRDKTKFTYVRENIPTEEEKKMFEEHLPEMLNEIKRHSEE